MHPWRKLHSDWLSSSRLRKLSDGAFRLWVMLLTTQDDDGYFELEDAKLAQLVAGTTTWNSERCKTLIEELIEVGLVVRDGNFIVLYRGNEFNGMLRPTRPSSGFYYRSNELRNQSISQLAVSDGQLPVSGGLEERREDSDKNEIQRREDEIPYSMSGIDESNHESTETNNAKTELRSSGTVLRDSESRKPRESVRPAARIG
jgi:hypothetical protein